MSVRGKLRGAADICGDCGALGEFILTFPSRKASQSFSSKSNTRFSRGQQVGRAFRFHVFALLSNAFGARY
jgi:hypothetical protein